MLLKAYTLTGPAKFKTVESIVITIQATKDNINLVKDFLQWSIEEGVYPNIGGTTSSIGFYRGGFDPEDAEKIVEWLKNNGVIEE